jgi:hypothetical protein
MKFLTIDHVSGGGRKHRDGIGCSDFNRWLRSNGYPPGYQVLCMNCNFAKGMYGQCPHADRTDEEISLKAATASDGERPDAISMP